MSLAAVGQAILVVTAVSVLVVMTTVVVTATLVVRGVRRGYRTARARVLQMPVAATVSSHPDGRPRQGLTAATVGSPAWWVVQRDRHRMWRAVTAAQHAVGVAQQAGAPVGDLPSLARQLTTAARGVDAVLRASASARGLRRDVASERDRIETAAAAIQHAAVHSLKATVGADTDPLVSAVQLEVDALAAGVAAHRLGLDSSD